jgi:preprotein translocase subunit SecY
MSTPVHDHSRPGVRSSLAPLVTLGSRHFAVLIVVLLLFATLFLILLSPLITR